MPSRDHSTTLFIVLVVLVLGTGAYLNRVPDSPVVRAAERWPLVGPLASRWRQRFAPPPPVKPPPPMEPELIYVVGSPGSDAQREIDFEPVEAHPRVWTPEGTVVFADPSSESEAIHRTPELSKLPWLERDDDWFRVLIGSRRGWIHLPGYEEGEGRPPLGRDPEPPGPLPGRAPRTALLDASRRLLSGDGREIRIGRYRAFTDVEPGKLFELADHLVAELEEVYEERYGVRLVGGPEEVILIFAQREDYAALRARTRMISGLPASGHVGHGLVAIPVGGQPAIEVAGTLVHEIVHLLNRRGLGPALPPWLGEGLADELGQSKIDEDGGLVPGHPGGEASRLGERITYSGAKAAAIQLRQAQESGELISLEELVGLDWEGFVGSERRALHYAQSSYLIRFLLSVGDARLAAGFKRFLQEVSAGGSVSGDALREHLGVDWPELEVRFRAWVRLVADGVELAASG